MNKHGRSVFSRLRLGIALACTGLTGLVLLAACFIAFRAAVRETQSSAEAAFASQCQTVETFLCADTGVDREKLLRFAAQNRLLIAVNDGGALLTFVPDGSLPALTALLDAMPFGDAFPSPQTDGTPQSTHVFAAGAHYRARLASEWDSRLCRHSTLVFQPEDTAAAVRLARIYVLVFAGGLALLFAIAWLLSRQMLRPAEAAQREQLRFFAMASHELKSPLAVISSSLEMLRRGLVDFAQRSDCMQQEIDQMARLVDDMLLLSGSGTGRWTLRLCPVQPENAILSACEAYAGLMEAKGQTLCLRLPENPLPMIDADEQRLRQILTVLLDNALCHAPPGSEILLCAAQNEHKVILQVVDHGTGIPDRDKKHIFDYFYRSSDDAVRPGPGSQNSGHWGLGLAVASELARLHKAALTVSDTPGGGTTFTLTIPENRGAAKAVRPPPGR